jgi:hypothetical protein
MSPRLLALVLATAAVSCAAPMMRYPSGDASSYVEGTGGKSGHLAPGEMRFRRDICKDVDLRVDYRSNLDENALADFLQTQGFKTTPERARNDLVYLDVEIPNSSERVRLRVAILKTPQEAARELHDAVLDHGEGSWGIHRGNLAVLAPIADTSDAVSFAVKTKLACWGVFVMAGRDDSFVVPGAYTEL